MRGAGACGLAQGVTEASPEVAGRAEAYFGPGGRLRGVLGPGYEAREQQALMAEAVWRVLEGGGAALLEAGTGTGKSLAYLIPLADVLRRHPGRRAVVSTHTIHLQEQLLQRDLPVAAAAVGVDLQPAVAKGWANYLCRLRLERCREEPGWLLDVDPGSLGGQLERLSRWAEASPTGSRSELPEEVEPTAWAAVAADPDRCGRRRCPLYERCFYFLARQRLQQARLVIANHHLLLADLVLRRESGAPDAAVLPDFDYLVMDEAHHLEDVAISHLGAQLSESAVLGRLRRLRRLRETPLGPAVAEAESALAGLFQRLRGLLAKGPAAADAEVRTLRLRPEVAESPAVAAPLGEAVDSLEALAHAAFRLGASAAGEGEAAGDGAGDPRALELLGLARWAERVAVQLDLLVRAAEPQMVFWLEQPAGAGRELVLRAAPLDVSAVLGGELFGPRRACVLTSATLVGSASAGAFSALRRRLGLDGVLPRHDRPGEASAEVPEAAGIAGPAEAPEEAWEDGWEEEPAAQPEPDERGLVRLRVGQLPPDRWRPGPGRVEGILPAPFDFRRQARVAVPLDVEEPDHSAFSARLADWVARLAGRIGGRTFVLFTSVRALEQAAQALAGHPAMASLRLLCQGRAPRGQLLERFRQAEGRGLVLFGTDSFWEGVDVPGPALSLVVLARLPFPVPDHPLAQARAEQLRAAGRNPFLEDALPRAVLKFRQGFGRLIRSASDRGVVAVWDRRLLTRPYGRRFLGALPPCELVAGPAETLLEELAAWIGPPPPSPSL